MILAFEKLKFSFPSFPNLDEKTHTPPKKNSDLCCISMFFVVVLVAAAVVFSFSRYTYLHCTSQAWLEKSNTRSTALADHRHVEKSSQGHGVPAGTGLQITWLLVTATPNGAVPQHRICWITKCCSCTSKPKAITSCCDSTFRLSFYWPVCCPLLTEASTIFTPSMYRVRLQ